MGSKGVKPDKWNASVNSACPVASCCLRTATRSPVVTQHTLPRDKDPTPSGQQPGRAQKSACSGCSPFPHPPRSATPSSSCPTRCRSQRSQSTLTVRLPPQCCSQRQGRPPTHAPTHQRHRATRRWHDQPVRVHTQAAASVRHAVPIAEVSIAQRRHLALDADQCLDDYIRNGGDDLLADSKSTGQSRQRPHHHHHPGSYE